MPFNQLVGITKCDSRQDGILELVSGRQHLNHVGTIHAGALYGLAEASSGQFLADHLKEDEAKVLPVLRKADIKYRKPAEGALYTTSKFVEEDWDTFHETLAKKSRALISIAIEVRNQDEQIVAMGGFDWFVMKGDTPK